MYERMLDKNATPTDEEIANAVGAKGMRLLGLLEDFLRSNYNLSRELRFPFGNSYGWGNKYSHASLHLCYLFFEQGAFTVTLQIGKKELPAFNEAYGGFLPQTKTFWENRYSCGEGGWIHYRVLTEPELADVMHLIRIKKKPISSKKTVKDK